MILRKWWAGLSAKIEQSREVARIASEKRRIMRERREYLQAFKDDPTIGHAVKYSFIRDEYVDLDDLSDTDAIQYEFKAEVEKFIAEHQGIKVGEPISRWEYLFKMPLNSTEMYQTIMFPYPEQVVLFKLRFM